MGEGGAGDAGALRSSLLLEGTISSHFGHLFLPTSQRRAQHRAGIWDLLFFLAIAMREQLLITHHAPGTHVCIYIFAHNPEMSIS